MPLARGTTEDENVACSHRLCLSVLRKHEPGDQSSWIPACAGMTDKCGNDMGVEFIQIYQGIFVAMTFGYNRHVVMLNLLQHHEIPKQVRNDRGVRNDGGVRNPWCRLPAALRRMRMLHVRTGLCLSVLRKHEPRDRSIWIPACAGMTDKCGNDI